MGFIDKTGCLEGTESLFQYTKRREGGGSNVKLCLAVRIGVGMDGGPVDPVMWIFTGGSCLHANHAGIYSLWGWTGEWTVTGWLGSRFQRNRRRSGVHGIVNHGCKCQSLPKAVYVIFSTI